MIAPCVTFEFSGGKFLMRDDEHIYVNGDPYVFSRGKTVTVLLEELGFADRQVVVELNLLILQKEEWHQTGLNPGDRVEIIGFVGGGSLLFPTCL